MARSKYNAKKTEVDGYVFDSKKEARRYQELVLLEGAGEIAELECHPKFPIYVNQEKVCTYIADFRYLDIQKNAYIVEDVKGVKTAIYRLKKKLMKAAYGIEIIET